MVVSYTYDKKKGVYHRSSDGQETIEYETDKPIELDNILIMETYHEVIDNAGRRKVDMDSGGNAYLLQKGKLQQVQWASEDGLIVPVKMENQLDWYQVKLGLMSCQAIQVLQNR